MSAPASAATSTSPPKHHRLERRGGFARRSPDQLERILARPFRRPRDRRDLAALRIDQHRGGHAQGPAYRLKILKNLGFLIVEIAEPDKIGLFQKRLGLLGVAGVDIDRHHLEIRTRKL